MSLKTLQLRPPEDDKISLTVKGVVSGEQEAWRPVVGCSRCRISDLGRFWVVRAKKNRKGGRKQEPRVRSGDIWIKLIYDDGTRRKVHMANLVLETFVGPCPEGLECCHFDDNRANNRLTNLRWDTHAANKNDAVRNGIGNQPVGARNASAKMSDEEVLEARRLRKEGWSLKALCEKYHMTVGPMSLLTRGLAWKHLK